MIDRKAVGRKIKYYRVQAGKTQQEVAEALNFSYNYLSQIERGLSKTSLEKLSIISTYLGVSVQSLIADVNQDVPEYLTTDIIERMNNLPPEDKRHLLVIIESFIDRNNLKK
ncbi:MAG: helix-turn-helix domain-containing protein [Oscillospiraceae bacterium]|nr:helix-turn-helix domain-containing protein [Oscillospiraceae bacterium]